MSRHLLLLTTVVMTAGVYYMRTRTPFNVRNKNPLNITAPRKKYWKGQTGLSGRFAVFDTIENGFRAAYRNLLTYKKAHGLDTISGIINRWAPSNENPTQDYINYLANELMIMPDETLQSSDYAPLILAMSVFEGAKGRNAYNIEQVNQGIALA
ncbi:MAG: hypothetical protein OCD00_03100 [Colwellia sp.]